MNSLQELKPNGYYILKSVDDTRKMTEYLIVKNENPEGTQKQVYCDLNRAAYLKAKHELNLQVVEEKASFLNYVPFAHRNKENVPMMEFSTKATTINLLD